MLPILIHAKQAVSSPHIRSRMPIYRHHLWVVDANALVGDNEKVGNSPVARRVAQARLKKTLEDILGPEDIEKVKVFPLFSPGSEAKAGGLRAVVVKMPPRIACQDIEFPDHARQFKDAWQKSSGQECFALSQDLTYKDAFDLLITDISRGMPDPARNADGYAVVDGWTIPQRFDSTLAMIDGCVQSSLLNEVTPRVKNESGGPRL